MFLSATTSPTPTAIRKFMIFRTPAAYPFCNYLKDVMTNGDFAHSYISHLSPISPFTYLSLP